STAQVTIVTGHPENGNIEAASAALNIRPEFFAPLDDALRAAYMQGGVVAIATLSKLARPFAQSGRSSGSTAETPAQNRTSPSNPRVS
ncbi:MAG TPA: hypothetical protein VNJ04_09795, partial [Gemmatimonadaceae bacterium]|nr:hypothetical protein [Gemmatimonadaceae bacterium]